MITWEFKDPLNDLQSLCLAKESQFETKQGKNGIISFPEKGKGEKEKKRENRKEKKGEEEKE